LLKTCGVKAIPQPLSHSLLLEKTKIAGLIATAKLIRSHQLMKLGANPFVGRCSRPKPTENLESPLRGLGVFLQHISWAFRIPE
jgi:hypothetical protein